MHAELDPNEYPAGIKIPDARVRTLDDGILARHDRNPEWNYPLQARPDTRWLL